ncbi:MAG: citrate/2-methylcitrate synthase [Kibdelosporangium sp.]
MPYTVTSAPFTSVLRQVSTVDHGVNASTFTARVVASSGADVVRARACRCFPALASLVCRG